MCVCDGIVPLPTAPPPRNRIRIQTLIHEIQRTVKYVSFRPARNHGGGGGTNHWEVPSVPRHKGHVEINSLLLTKALILATRQSDQWGQGVQSSSCARIAPLLLANWARDIQKSIDHTNFAERTNLRFAEGGPDGCRDNHSNTKSNKNRLVCCKDAFPRPSPMCL